MFSIKKQTRIFLYGAASIGKIVYENLKAKDITAAGFIDKRADELEHFMERPVSKIEDFFMNESKDTVVVISVKNVFEHDAIAEKFINKGFCNLIFKPKSVLENRASADDIRVGNIYDALLDGSAIDLEKINSITKLAGYFYKDYAKVREEGDECIAMIPVSLLYTNDYDPEKHKWGNVNLYSFFTHDDFFQSLAGDSTKGSDYYVTEYCEYAAKQQGDITITDKWRKNVVANRAMIYEQMRLSLEIDPQFFYRNPATASWNNDRKYFNLTSGKHRTLFMVSQGYYYIPVRISKTDYETWLRKEDVDKIWGEMQSLGINKYEGIVAHPYFYKFSAIGWVFMVSCIHEISNVIAKKIYAAQNKVDYSGFTIVDEMNSYHSLSRFFSHMGATVYRLDDKKEECFVDSIENVSINKLKEGIRFDAKLVNINSKEEVDELNKVEGKLYFALSDVKLNQKELTKGYINGKYTYLYEL